MARDELEPDEAFICEVCWHYYVNDMTQAEVAKALDVTRLRVNQAIRRAREIGMVNVQIDSPVLPRLELRRTLQDRFGIAQVIVAPANRENYDFHGPVGAALATYLNERLRVEGWTAIGVSWGMTLQSAVRRLPQQSHAHLEIVSMMGGTTEGASFNSFGIASAFAHALGASYSLLAAPIFLSEGVDRDAFLGQKVFQDQYDKFETLDAAILTASDVSPKSFLVAHGLPKEVTAEELNERGAVGDVLGHFLDADGNTIRHPIDLRTIGISLETMMRIPNKILAAAGPHKVEIILAAARRGLIDTLVTDDVTAEMLLGGSEIKPLDAER